MDDPVHWTLHSETDDVGSCGGCSLLVFFDHEQQTWRVSASIDRMQLARIGAGTWEEDTVSELEVSSDGALSRLEAIELGTALVQQLEALRCKRQHMPA